MQPEKSFGYPQFGISKRFIISQVIASRISNRD